MRYFRTLFLLSIIVCSIKATTAQQTIGTFVNEPEALNAYTLFSVTFGKSSYLVDNCGELINQWDHTYRAGLAGYMTPDGRLLRSSRITHPTISQTSQGGLIELYSWDGNLDWSYDFNTDVRTQHHDMVYMDNGNILVLVWEYITTTEVRALGRDVDEYPVRALYGEAVYEIQPVGADSAVVVWEWHLRDRYIQEYDPTKQNYVADISEHPRKYNFNYSGISKWSHTDWTHCNALDYNPERDEVLINCRGGNEFWIVDHSTTTEEAAMDTGGDRGHGGDFLYRWGNPQAYGSGIRMDLKLYGAHGLEWIPEDRPYGGSIIAYNNGIDRPGPNYSTVEVVTPAMDIDGNYIMDSTGVFLPKLAAYTFTHDPAEDFYSNYQSNACFLPNGNLFTNQGDNGHFIEFDDAGQIVWEYVNPAGFLGPAVQGQTPQSSSVFTATRLPVDHPAFDGKDLTPQGVIELNSDYTDCMLYSSTEEVTEILAEIELKYDRDEEMLLIQHQKNIPFTSFAYSIQGKMMVTQSSNGHLSRISTAIWPAGSYLVQVIDRNDHATSTLIIK